MFGNRPHFIWIFQNSSNQFAKFFTHFLTSHSKLFLYFFFSQHFCEFIAQKNCDVCSQQCATVCVCSKRLTVYTVLREIFHFAMSFACHFFLNITHQLLRCDRLKPEDFDWRAFYWFYSFRCFSKTVEQREENKNNKNVVNSKSPASSFTFRVQSKYSYAYKQQSMIIERCRACTKVYYSSFKPK